MGSYLGLDVGTTGCKAVVFDNRGRQLAAAYRGYPVFSPREGWAEIDSTQVVESCMAVICDAAIASSSDPVAAIGISSQGEAFTPIGPDGGFLGNAMVSSDTRAARIANEWSADFGREKLYEITGHTAYPMFSLFKLLWLRENQQDVWQAARRFYCFEELIHHRLGIEPAISWPLAGRTMLFDVRRHEWSEEVLSVIDMDRTKLARTLPSGSIVGTIPHEVASDLGLPDGVIVVAGGHDQPCCALGAGVASAGRAVYGMGTVDCITPAFSAPIFSRELLDNNLCTYDFTMGGMYTTVAYSLTGGNLLQWFRDEFGQQEVEQAERTGTSAYELLLAAMAREPTNLMVLPYFTPSGTPHFDTETPGAMLGLRLTTKRSEVLRALLEGVAFEMRLNLDILARSGIPVSELVATGGGAKSRKWLQLKADVLSTPISIAEVTEAGCMGVAMLAFAAHSGEDVSTITREWVRITEAVEPDPANSEFYTRRFSDYLKLQPTLKALP